MTSDGIDDADWSQVHELALDVANSSTAVEDANAVRARESLFALLDQLDRKYGPKPSLLATRADYVDSLESRDDLLHIAYGEAERTGDGTNLILVAHSLAEFYIEEVPNLEQGAAWLRAWRDQLGVASSEEDRAELARLECIVRGSPA